jgi:hypothetical protein
MTIPSEPHCPSGKSDSFRSLTYGTAKALLRMGSDQRQSSADLTVVRKIGCASSLVRFSCLTADDRIDNALHVIV